MFEIVLIERDSVGNPKLRPNGGFIKKSFVSDKGDIIADFYNRNAHRPISKKSHLKKLDLQSKPTIEKTKKASKKFDDGVHKCKEK